MATGQTSELALRLTARECEELLLVLEQALKERRVEQHRTEAFHAKEVVRTQVERLESLVEKVRCLRD
jgi:hypothetical protein